MKHQEKPRRRKHQALRTAAKITLLVCLLALGLLIGYYFGQAAGYRLGRISRIPAADPAINTATEMPEGVQL